MELALASSTTEDPTSALEAEVTLLQMENAVLRRFLGRVQPELLQVRGRARPH